MAARSPPSQAARTSRSSAATGSPWFIVVKASLSPWIGSHRSSVARNRSIVTGFTRQASMPAARQRSSSPFVALAVTATMGVRLEPRSASREVAFREQCVPVAKCPVFLFVILFGVIQGAEKIQRKTAALEFPAGHRWSCGLLRPGCD